MGICITFHATKGGVAKTTSSMNFAWELSLKKKVLFIDLDEQGNSTYNLTGSIRREYDGKGIYEAIENFGKNPINNYIYKTKSDKMDILPSCPKVIELNALMESLSKSKGYPSYVFLSALIDSVREEYDYIVIDTPATKDSRTMSAIYAADYIMIPMRTENYSLQSLTETYEEVCLLREKEKLDVKILGAFFVMFEKQYSLTKTINAAVEKFSLKELVMKTKIRKCQAIMNSTYSTPVIDSEPRSNASKDYKELVGETLKRIKKGEGR